MIHKRSNAMDEVYFALCKSLDTPRSLGLWLRYREGIPSWDQSFRPSDYNEPVSFAHDYLARSFISKYKGSEFGIDKRKVALQAFEQSEVKCKLTNDDIRRFRAGPMAPDVSSVISLAQRKISRILGPSPIASTRHSCWTTGAALDLKRSHAQPDNKIVRLPITVTRRAAPLLSLHISTDPHWFQALTGLMPEGPYSVLKNVFSYVDGGRYETVPKSAKTDRSIIVEPRGNMFLQKGVGNFIRKRLGKSGCDLNDQSTNQKLAAFAYDFKLATIDLEAASDSISYELVHLLLPVDWANYLSDLRSGSVLIDGKYRRLEKFSSMGNGFTFELESLIFFALSESVVESVSPGLFSSVYGDDIIVPQECVPLLSIVFETLGFRVNTDKTFVEGNFFESCGRHYFQGRDVTPVYQKESLDEIEAIRCGNRLTRAVSRLNPLGIDPSSAVRCLRRLFTLYRECRVPSFAQRDDGWLVPWEELQSSYDRNNGFRCFVVSPVSKTLLGVDEAWLAYSFRQCFQPETPTYLGIRRETRRYHVHKVWINF